MISGVGETIFGQGDGYGKEEADRVMGSGAGDESAGSDSESNEWRDEVVSGGRNPGDQ